MNTPLPAEPRGEPLLWLQLLGLGALPLEALLVLVLLAGTDPGPWPWLERGLAWALGGLAPALLLWQRPADVLSLLLISTPLRGRRELQRRLNGLQQGLGLRLALALGAVGLLPLLAWLDRWSVLARDLAVLPEAPRLVALLLSAVVLALMLWQWQQLLQAVWLLLRPAAAVAAAPALTAEEIAGRRLCLGLPLLLPDPLRFDTIPKPRQGKPPTAAELGQPVGPAAADTSATAASGQAAAEPAPVPAPAQSANSDQPDPSQPDPDQSDSDPTNPDPHDPAEADGADLEARPSDSLQSEAESGDRL